MDTLCKIRELYRALADFEICFEETYNIGLNEGVLLCTLDKEGQLSSSDIAERLALKPSNTSKVIKSVEDKRLVRRVVGKEDRRQMYFSLSPKGKEILTSLKCDQIKTPLLLSELLNRE
ncbi:MAG: MarR family transcriptional regulator [Bacteroidales bacterium]|uniref:winged helix DNA-binding protein n=1 Tax=Porphyromonas sp. TaxID=1924944 RepID=UPI00297B6ABE|nr:winged helix DNA-binding protein [Porphyromonas sp.]MDD7438929.1 MarR family transcriptional regulator [Bacteroidales bacterium]MDY3066513.1 MarR family transcriptional regulator [Porphyromonas sp.]